MLFSLLGNLSIDYEGIVIFDIFDIHAIMIIFPGKCLPAWSFLET